MLRRLRLIALALLLGPLVIGAIPTARVAAQQTADVGIVNVAFGELPEDVEPGSQFAIGVETAAGAGCSGTVSFRDHPPIELEAQRAVGTTCRWSVEVPPTVRPSTGTIVVDVTRSGQAWRLFGVTYVRPVGGGV